MPAEHLNLGTLSRRGAGNHHALDDSADDWLARSSANREWVMGAYADALAGRGRVLTLDELRREIGLDPS